MQNTSVIDYSTRKKAALGKTMHFGNNVSVWWCAANYYAPRIDVEALF